MIAIIIIYLFIWTANGILPDGSGSTIRRNTYIYTYHQNNTPLSNKTQLKSLDWFCE
jgi:hypothetical protein